MRKLYVLLTIVMVSTALMGQQTSRLEQPEKLFQQGKVLFEEANYVGALDFLTRYMDVSGDRQLREEASFMIAAAEFERGATVGGKLLEGFLQYYPESVHRHRAAFMLGSYHFDRKDWQDVIYWLEQSDLDYLNAESQEDHTYRMAYTRLQLGQYAEASQLFGLLSQNSYKYGDAGHYYYGYIAYKEGRYETALNHFDRVSNNPEFAEEVAFYRAQSTFFDGQSEQAIVLAEQFLSRFGHSRHVAEMERILGNSNYRLGRTATAARHYDQYMSLVENPLRGDAYFAGLSALESARYAQALAYLQQAVGERDELTQNAQLQLGQAYLKLNQKQQAQMAFEAATRDNFNPKVRETAMFNYALLAHDTNFSVFSESITLFENFLKEYPHSQHSGQVNDILAETFLTTKDYKAALDAINRIHNPAPRILEAKQMVLFQLGAQEFINGSMNRAVEHFNASIGMGNYDRTARNNAYYWRGESYYRIGNYSNAVIDFTQFVNNTTSSDENHSMGWYNLGYSRFKQKQYGQAMIAFQRFVSVEPDKRRDEYADALNRVGDSYYFSRNFAEAERYYAQAADVNPDAADYAAYQRAFVMGLQRNFQGKVNALDELMRRYPNSQYVDDALYEKSRALTMMGRNDEAIVVLQKLVNDFPNSPLTSQGGVQLGQLYYNNSDYPNSISAYKNVIKNFPGTDDARSALISLESVYRDMNDIESYVNYANALPGGQRITVSRQDSLTYLAAEGVYMRGTSKEEAQLALTRYLQSYPNGAYSSDANYHLGVLADEKGNKTQAMVHFRRVIDAGSMKFLENALTYAAAYEYETGSYNEAQAYYSRLAASARSAANRQTGYMGMVRSQTQLGNYHEAARAAGDLLNESSVSPEMIIEARYLRGKAYQQVREPDKAMQDFLAIANDTRSVYGAEAQFIAAETYYKWKSYDKAEAQVTGFMKQGTPHQYWMARALIVLTDTYIAQGNDFQARQYLESLKSNYKGGEADITEMINARLLQVNE